METPHPDMGGSLEVKVDPFDRPVKVSLDLNQDGVGGFTFQIAPVSDLDEAAEPYVSVSVDHEHVDAQISWPEWEDFIGSGDEATSKLDLGELIRELL